MNGGFFMKKIELEYQFELDNNFELKNIVVADQKEIFEYNDNILVKGKVFFEFEYLIDNDLKKLIREKDLEVSLSKNKYHLKDVSFTLVDYAYKIDNNQLYITLNYELKGEDVCLDKFCLLDEDDISNKLRDYFHRDIKTDLDENNIILLDPIIDEDKIKVEVNKNLINEEKIVDERSVRVKEEMNVKKPLFEEKYSTSYLYYRVKKDDSITSISEKFNMSEKTLLEINNISELKENMLLLIKKNV